METLLLNQEQTIGAMEQILSSFKKTGSDRRTPDYIKKKLNTLEEYWREFESNHSRLCEYQDENITYFRDNQYQQALGFYVNAKACIQQYLPKSLTEGGVAVQQLMRSGILHLGQGCMINTRNLTIYSHRELNSDIKINTVPEIFTAFTPPINHLINISLPETLDIGNYSEVSENKEKLREIHEKINVLKANQEQVDSISYHDIHHYTAIYIILVVVLILIVAVAWRWRGYLSGRNVANYNITSTAAAPAPAAQATATAANAATPGLSTSANDDHSYQCIVKSGRLSARKSNTDRKMKQDKGTSPFVQESVFKVCEQSV
ncbi:hypothetical protein ACJJTC_013148 [Scirpophaga incertulas]